MSCLVAAVMLTTGASSNDGPPPPADPLTATIRVEDAERFAALMKRTAGRPTAAQLQRDYLDPGSFGVSVFTPGRIVDANHLAAAIARKPADYAEALHRCLPWVDDLTADLRAIYLALHGALPDARLPQIYLVVGAGNSGGTAVSGAQVLGLEVLCRISPTQAAFRTTLRHFFAHETVHAFQQGAGLTVTSDPLLTQVLAEGAADFIARLVTGAEPNAERAAWALPREAALWRQFERDVVLTRKLSSADVPTSGSAERQAFKRWIGNYTSAPPGWPGELGYWLGMRIWERRYAAATDKRAVLQEMLSVAEPATVMAAGAPEGFQPAPLSR